MQPVSFGYTDGMSTEQIVDGPPRVHGQSARVEKNLPEAVFVGCLRQNFQRWTVRLGIADGPRLRRKVGSG